MDLQLGELVIWEVGGVKSSGTFLDNNEDGTSSVITEGGIVDINTNILKLDI